MNQTDRNRIQTRINSLVMTRDVLQEMAVELKERAENTPPQFKVRFRELHSQMDHLELVAYNLGWVIIRLEDVIQ